MAGRTRAKPPAVPSRSRGVAARTCPQARLPCCT
jgi:hypothetical protein